MSGSKRKSQYRKKVTEDFLNGLPTPAENEDIAIVRNSRGANIFEIEIQSCSIQLALMPNKFRNVIWIKRGDFVIVSHGEASADSKVNYLIQHVLNKDHIRHLKASNLWPEEFLSSTSRRDDDSFEMPYSTVDDDLPVDDGDDDTSIGEGQDEDSTHPLAI